MFHNIIQSNQTAYQPSQAYSIQQYVRKFVSDLWQVGGFLKGTPVSTTNRTDSHDITEILLKVALNTINLAQA